MPLLLRIFVILHGNYYLKGEKDFIHQFKNLLEIKFTNPSDSRTSVYKQFILDSLDFTQFPKLKRISGVNEFTQTQINQIAQSESIEELEILGLDSIPQCICNNKRLKKLKIIAVDDIPDCIKNMDIQSLLFVPIGKGGGRFHRLDIALNKILRKRFGDTTSVDYSDEKKGYKNLNPLEIKSLDTLIYKTERGDSLSPNIKNLKNLRYLKLDGEFRSIPEEINALSKLEVLEIEGRTYRKDNPLCRMPKSMKGLTSLQTFSMDDYVVDKFPPLYDIPSLKHILITRVVGIDSILDTMGRLKNLETFAYSEDGYKGFTDSLGFKVHKTMEQFVMEKDSLDLMDNIGMIDGYWWDSRGPNNPFPYVTSVPTLTYLTPNIGKWKKLQYFSLSNVRLESLPKSIGNLKAVDNFSVTHSFLKSLPQSFTNLNPILLNLEGNQFTSLPKVEALGKYNHARLDHQPFLPRKMRNAFMGSYSVAEENCDFTSKKIQASPKLKKRLQKASDWYLEYKLFGRNKKKVQQYHLDK